MSSFEDSYFQQSCVAKVFQGVGSLGAIFICPTFNARQVQMLKEKGIQAVISAQKQQKINLPKRQIPAYLYLQIQDDINFNISQFFQESFNFIEENRRLTNILVHCSTGLNCSVAIVLAYLIKKYQYTYQQALTLIRRRYQNFNIHEFNPGFVHRLEYFAVQKGDFKLVKENHMRRKIQRTRKTFDGIIRSYSKEMTTDQKLRGVKSPTKDTYRSLASKQLFPESSQKFIPYQSAQLLDTKNPEQTTQSTNWTSKQLKSKRLSPKKTSQQIQDEQHHKKIVSEIFLLSEQSKIYRSKRIQSMNSENSAMKNYQRLGKTKKRYENFYSPLKKYDKYEMFSQNKLNVEYQAYNTQEF